MDLLKKFKLNRKELSVNNKPIEEYYQSLLNSAKVELKAEDISEEVLKTEYGQNCIIHCANLMIDGIDRATNPTMILMKNTLSSMTKGERYSDD